MYVNNKIVDLNSEESYSYYLKNRFGYKYQDYNFKGYMFGDGIKKGEIYETY